MKSALGKQKSGSGTATSRLAIHNIFDSRIKRGRGRPDVVEGNVDGAGIAVALILGGKAHVDPLRAGGNPSFSRITGHFLQKRREQNARL